METQTERVAVILIVLLMTVLLFATASIVLAQQTVFASESLTDAVNDREVYTQIESELIAPSAEESPLIQEVNKSIETGRVVSGVTNGNQTNALVDELYAYLHGDRNELQLLVDTQLIADDTETVVDRIVQDVYISTIVDSIDATKTINNETGVNTTVTATTVDRMLEGPDEYKTVQAEFQSEFREELTARIIDRRSSAVLLQLIGIDPPESEAARDRLVRSNEDEISDAIAETGILDRAVGEARDRIAETIEAETNAFQESFEQDVVTRRENAAALLESSATSSTDPLEREILTLRGGVANIVDPKTDSPEDRRAPDITSPATELQLAVLDGLLTDQPYPTFVDRVDTSRDGISQEVSDFLQDELTSKINNGSDISDKLEPETRDMIDEAAWWIQMSNRAAYALGLAVIVLGGITYRISRSIKTVGLSVSVSFVFTGILLTQLWHVRKVVTGSFNQGDETVPTADLLETVTLSVVNEFVGQARVAAVLFILTGIAVGSGVYVREKKFTDHRDSNETATSTTDATDEVSDSSELIDLPGIEDLRAEDLQDAGYNTLSELTDATEEELADIDGINLAVAGQIKSKAAAEVSDESGQAESSPAETTDSEAEQDTEVPESTPEIETDSTEEPAVQADDAFVSAAPRISSQDTRSIDRGEYIHEYRGQLTTADDAGKSVRIFALAPNTTETVQTAFNKAVGGWYNCSSHSNVVQIVDRGSEPRPWFATEVPAPAGQTLRDAHDALSVPNIRDTIVDVAEAVRIANLYNTRHLGLDPDTVWITDTPNGYVTHVDDWGVTHACQLTTSSLPTTPFIPPELRDDSTLRSEQADIYSLGALTYFGLVGRPPAGPDTDSGTDDRPLPPSQLTEHPGVDEDVDKLIFTALADDPSDRHNSISAYKSAASQAIPSHSASTDDSSSATSTSPGDNDRQEHTEDTDNVTGNHDSDSDSPDSKAEEDTNSGD